MPRHSPTPTIPPIDITTPHISRETTDVPVRGTIPLPSGETAVVLDGGRVLVCKAPRLLNEASSQRVIEEATRRFTPARCALDAIANMNGPSREQTMARRREETQRTRDHAEVGRRPRNVVATIVDIPDAEYPSFTESAIGTGMSDVERQARTEAANREVPDVRY